MAMLKWALQWLLAACLLMGTSFAATDSFIGDWKLDPSKSRFIDVIKVGNVGGNAYTFDFGEGPERITVDGTEQPARQGTTLSVTAEAADTWKVVRKKDGRMVQTATWKLSRDGMAFGDDYTAFEPDSSSSTVHFVFERQAAGPGFVGA